MSQKLPQNFSDIYGQLNSIEQSLLQILAINYAPMTQGNLYSVARRTKGLPIINKDLFNMRDFKYALDRLAKFDLIGPVGTGVVQCKSVLVDEILARISKNDYFRELVDAVQCCVPVPPYVYIDSQLIVREIRIGLYTGNADIVVENLNRSANYYGERFDAKKVVVDVCTNPLFHAEMFDSLHPAIKKIVFQNMVDHAIMSYRPLSEEQCASLAKYGTVDEREYVIIRNIYAMYLIFRGNLTEAENIVQKRLWIYGFNACTGVCGIFKRGKQQISGNI